MLHCQGHSQDLSHFQVPLEELLLLHLTRAGCLLSLNLFDLFNGISDVLIESDVILNELSIEDVLVGEQLPRHAECLQQLVDLCIWILPRHHLSITHNLKQSYLTSGALYPSHPASRPLPARYRLKR